MVGETYSRGAIVPSNMICSDLHSNKYEVYITLVHHSGARRQLDLVISKWESVSRTLVTNTTLLQCDQRV